MIISDIHLISFGGLLYYCCLKALNYDTLICYTCCDLIWYISIGFSPFFVLKFYGMQFDLFLCCRWSGSLQTILISLLQWWLQIRELASRLDQYSLTWLHKYISVSLWFYLYTVLHADLNWYILWFAVCTLQCFLPLFSYYERTINV